MSGPLSRAARFLLHVTAQAVPALGVFGVSGLSWPPAGGLLLYWLESVLTLGGLVLLLTLFARRARAAGRADELAEIKSRRIATRDVLLLQGGAFAFWGIFFGAFLFILIANGHLHREELEPALHGAPALVGLAMLLLLVDLARFRNITAADLELRVGAGNRRFGLFFFVGFIGIFGSLFFGKPLLLFAVFAVIKALFEIGALFDRTPAKL